jgi:tetratricopeptide (TPR) repeat protein
VWAGRPMAAAAAVLDSIGPAQRPVQSSEIELVRAVMGAMPSGEPRVAVARVLRALAHEAGVHTSTTPFTPTPSVARSRSMLAMVVEVEAGALVEREARATAWLDHSARFPGDREAARGWLESIGAEPAGIEGVLRRVEAEPVLVEPIGWALAEASVDRVRPAIEALEALRETEPAARWIVAERDRQAGHLRSAMAGLDGLGKDGSPAAERVRALAAAEAGDLELASAAIQRLLESGEVDARLVAIKARLELGQAAEASELAVAIAQDRAIETRPRLEAALMGAEGHLARREADQAASMLSEAIALDAYESRAFALRARLHEQGGPRPDREAWARDIQALRDVDAQGLEWALLRAEQWTRQGRWDQAWAAASRALEIDGLDRRAVEVLARVGAARAEGPGLPSTEARAWLERRVGASAGTGSPRWRLALVGMKAAALQGEMERAPREGMARPDEALLRTLDDEWELISGSGMYWPLAAHERRLGALAQGVEVWPPGAEWSSRLERAMALAERHHRREVSELVLERADQAFVAGARRATLALMLAWLGLEKPADEGLEQARAVLPLLIQVATAEDLRWYLGVVGRRGYTDRILGPREPGNAALVDLEPWRGTNARADIAYLVGASAWSEGRGDEALALLEVALEFEPGHVWASNDLGYFLAEAGRELARAERHLLVAYRGAPMDASILDSLAWLRYRQGIIEDRVDPVTGEPIEGALTLLRRAVATDKGFDNPTIFDHYGDALWRAGLKLEAERAWTHAQRVGLRREAEMRAQGRVGGDSALSELSARLRSIESKLTSARLGQEPAVAEQGERP